MEFSFYYINRQISLYVSKHMKKRDTTDKTNLLQRRKKTKNKNNFNKMQRNVCLIKRICK